jgi:hypothetical protein
MVVGWWPDPAVRVIRRPMPDYILGAAGPNHMRLGGAVAWRGRGAGTRLASTAARRSSCIALAAPSASSSPRSCSACRPACQFEEYLLSLVTGGI